MKEYIEPIVEILIFTEDIITVSGDVGEKPIDITPNDGDTIVGGLL